MKDKKVSCRLITLRTSKRENGGHYPSDLGKKGVFEEFSDQVIASVLFCFVLFRAEASCRNIFPLFLKVLGIDSITFKFFFKKTKPNTCFNTKDKNIVYIRQI